MEWAHISDPRGHTGFGNRSSNFTSHRLRRFTLPIAASFRRGVWLFGDNSLLGFDGGGVDPTRLVSRTPLPCQRWTLLLGPRRAVKGCRRGLAYLLCGFRCTLVAKLLGGGLDNIRQV